MYYYGMVFNAAHVLALNRLCPRCLDTDSQNPHPLESKPGSEETVLDTDSQTPTRPLGSVHGS